SLVAHLHGVQGVASSNPATPTTSTRVSQLTTANPFFRVTQGVNQMKTGKAQGPGFFIAWGGCDSWWEPQRDRKEKAAFPRGRRPGSEFITFELPGREKLNTTIAFAGPGIGLSVSIPQLAKLGPVTKLI
ncbi:MAG: hypothetical protein LC098_03290, partial [Burkholderiales bacterium]|nr:hypothetical protein [Burkholderiales bacterium]